MTTEQDLFALERQFWTGDADFYRKNLDDKCLVAFTEMSGLMNKEDVAGMIKEGQRWGDLDLKKKGFLELPGESVFITYEASAKRPGGEPYKAVVSSGYVRRNGGWKMAFHQQTPLKTE